MRGAEDGRRVYLAKAHVRLRPKGVARAAARAGACEGARRRAALGVLPALDADDGLGLELDEVLLLVQHVDVVGEGEVKVKVLVHGLAHLRRVVVVVLRDVADGPLAPHHTRVLAVREDLPN